MQRLELNVEQTDAHERRKVALVVDGVLELAQQVAESLRWRRDEVGVSRPGSTDPVLRTTHLAGLLLGSSGASEQPAVYLGQEPHRDGETAVAAEFLPCVAERRYVTADFLHVGVNRFLPGRLDLEQIHQGRLGTFDLGRENRFLANEGVDEPLDGGHQVPGQIEQPYLLLGSREYRHQLTRELQGWIPWRQRKRDEGADLFSRHGAALVLSGLPSHCLPSKRSFHILVQ